MAEETNTRQHENPERNQIFFKLFTRNQAQIYSYILTLISNVNEVDDIFQDVSSSMWEHFGDYRLGTDFAAWGVRIARNKVIDYIRKNKRSRIRYSDETIQLITDYQSQIDNQKDRRIQALRECTLKLSPTDKQLIRFKYIQKISTKELSERIGRSVHGVYKSLSRIHYLLYNCIQRVLASEDAQ